MPTQKKLTETVEKVIAIYRQWAAAEEPIRMWQGQPAKCISGAVDASIRELQKLCQATDFKQPGWEIVLAADLVFEQFDRWEREYALRPDATHPAGHALLHQRIEALAASLEPRPSVTLESPAALVKLQPPVTTRQIAKMYGWKRINGDPDEAKVQEELNHYAEHKKFKHWSADLQSPDQMRHDAEIQERWNKRCEGMKKSLAEQEDINRPAPESLDQLLLQGVAAKQILKIKPELSSEEILQRASQLGLSMQETPGYERTTKGDRLRNADDENQRQEQEAMRLANVDTHDDLNDVEQQVLTLRKEGYPIADIVELLKDDYPELTLEQAADMIPADEKEVAGA